MRMRAVVLVILSLLIAPGYTQAEWQSLGPWKVTARTAHGVELGSGAAWMRVLALSPSVVRLSYAPDGRFRSDVFAVLEKPGFTAPAIQIREDAETVQVGTGAITVRVEKTTGRVAFVDEKGNILSEDAPHYPPAWNGSAFRVWKEMPLDEQYFGLGDKAGPTDHRNQAFTMWNTDAYGWNEGTDPLYKSVPFFLGVRQGRAYGIFLDNTFRSSFDFGKASRSMYSFGSDGGALDYYFFYGPAPRQVIEDYTQLTGRAPLPPRWALGYQQSRYSYYPEARVYEIAKQFRTRKIPCDVIYLDIDYEQDHKSFTVDRQKFPTFEKMIGDLGEQGFKVITIVDPHLKQEPGYKPYDEGHAKGYFVTNPDGTEYVGNVWPGPSVFPDFTRAEVRQWWGGLIGEWMKKGVAGIWNDMNEPAVFRYPQKTIPLDAVQSIEGRKTDEREAHNLYGIENVRATYDGLLRWQPNTRPFVLTRAGFAGAQRYAATWTGDNQSTWTHYRLTIPTLLSLGVSGWGMVGNDVGGFDGSPTPELLTRWIELGAFEPMFRDHTSTGTRDQEPWVHGPEQEAIRRRYIELRYRLMPYLYTSMEETSRTGVPLMRPMFLEFPQSEAFRQPESNDKEFMFGPDLLVAPKIDERLDPYDIVFPQAGWYDFWTGGKVGSAGVRVDPPLDMLPLYARPGAIIPMEEVTQNTVEKAPGPLQVRVYPGPDCRGSFYWDDGATFDYKQGEFARTEFLCREQAGAVEVIVGARQGSYTPHWTQMAFTVFGAPGAPRTIVADEKRLTGRYDAVSHSVTFTVPVKAAGQKIELTY
jgi:alpha-glucosidase